IWSSSPFRNTPFACASEFRQSRCVILRPSGRIHQTSGRSLPLPVKKRVRRKIGCARRSSIRRRVKSSSACSSSPRPQSNQEISLSWHHALLLPPCVRPHSSPPSSIGTPCESRSVARKFRCCRARNSSTALSSVGPSAPQFHERLSFVPSLPPSPFASLCLSLYDTRSRSVNPSCAVTKLIDANGRRVLAAYRSSDPDSRYARSRTFV